MGPRIEFSHDWHLIFTSNALRKEGAKPETSLDKTIKKRSTKFLETLETCIEVRH